MTISTTNAEAPARAHPLPMLLTLARIAAGPLVAALVLWGAHMVYIDPARAGAIYAAAAALFILAALTDWVDGWLARKLGAVTPLGAALDHCADKVLIVCALVALAYAALPVGLVIAAVLLLARDVAIGGLREGLSASGEALPVSQLGKWKAAAEMAGVAAFLLAQPAALWSAQPGLTQALGWAASILLWAAVALAYLSAAGYLAAALKKN